MFAARCWKTKLRRFKQAWYRTGDPADRRTSGNRRRHARELACAGPPLRCSRRAKWWGSAGWRWLIAHSAIQVAGFWQDQAFWCLLDPPYIYYFFAPAACAGRVFG